MLEPDGAAHFPGLLGGAAIERLRALADAHVSGGPGARLVFLSQDLEPVTALARTLIGPAVRPVRAVVFDKREDTNWAVAWHQDRTIVVRERIETTGFGPWSTKHGHLHVEPPFDVLARMLTMRVHLDDCGEGNAPLKVALGSHRLGRVPTGDVAAKAGACEQRTCLAKAGDIWAYATPVLHSSERAKKPTRRRVMQIDYAAADLPGGLIWRGLN